MTDNKHIGRAGGNLRIQLMSMTVEAHELMRGVDMLSARSEFDSKQDQLRQLKAAAKELYDGLEALRLGLPRK
jgi:hypothetical protein